MTPTTITPQPGRSTTQSARTVAELIERLGDIPPQRILMRPAPGTASESDVTWLDDHGDRLCELVEGTLVEKGTGLRESMLAMMLGGLLSEFVRARNHGLVSGEAGMMRPLPGLVRIPDVAFVSWARMPGGRMPTEPIPPVAPDIAVEILSESNTKKEMARKRREYFDAGGSLVWIIDPDDRTVAVYTAPEEFTLLRESQTLDGGAVLPGFTLPLRDLFAELDRVLRQPLKASTPPSGSPRCASFRTPRATAPAARRRR